MANVSPSKASAGADNRSGVAAAIGLCNPGDVLYFAAGGDNTWDFFGFTEAGAENTDAAKGLIEITKNITVFLEPGVILQESATNPIIGTKQTLMRFRSCTNCGITFSSGSKLKGQKALHAEASEWMAGAKFVACTGVTIAGTNELHFDGFYGDGLWFASGGNESVGSNTGVTVSNVWAANNYRSGITVEDCVGTFNNVKCTANFGTSPQVGMNLETDNGTDTLQVTVNNGYFEGRSHGLLVQIADALTPAIQITLNNCRSVRSTLAGDDPWGYDFAVTAASTPANSYIKANNCLAYGLKSAGYRFGATGTYPLDTAMAITLTNCTAENCSTANLDNPFDLALANNPTGGGIIFNNCVCIDDKVRKAVKMTHASSTSSTNVRGTIAVQNSAGLRSVDQGNSLLPRLNVIPAGRPRFSNKKKARTSANRGAV